MLSSSRKTGDILIASGLVPMIESTVDAIGIPCRRFLFLWANAI
jgi:hypothetical protein